MWDNFAGRRKTLFLFKTGCLAAGLAAILAGSLGNASGRNVLASVVVTPIPDSELQQSDFNSNDAPTLDPLTIVTPVPVVEPATHPSSEPSILVTPIPENEPALPRMVSTPQPLPPPPLAPAPTPDRVTTSSDVARQPAAPATGVSLSEGDLNRLLNSKLFLRKDDQDKKNYTFEVLLAPVPRSYQKQLSNVLSVAYDAQIAGSKTERIALWGSYTRSEFVYDYTLDYLADDATSVDEVETMSTAGVRSELRIGAWAQHMITALHSRFTLASRLGLIQFSTNGDSVRGKSVQTFKQIEGLAFLVNVGAGRFPENNKAGFLFDLDGDYFQGPDLSGKSINASLGWQFPLSESNKEAETIDLKVDVFGRLQIGEFTVVDPAEGEPHELKSNSASLGVRLHVN